MKKNTKQNSTEKHGNKTLKGEGAQSVPEKESGLEEWREFHFKTLKIKGLNLEPRYYLFFLQVLIFFCLVFVFLILPGLRQAVVKLDVTVLNGPAIVYLDNRLLGNLPRSYDVPAGTYQLRVEKAGFQSFEQEVVLARRVWNNRWNPPQLHLELRLKADSAQKQNPASNLWAEAWRSYLYRGLEGQRERAFDQSHPFPPVLSQGLRSYLSWVGPLPASWSADLQRGIASSTNIHQIGDFLQASSLIYQSVGSNARGEEASLTMGGAIAAQSMQALGPRSLALMSRQLSKRLLRLRPYSQSLEQSLAEWQPKDSKRLLALQDLGSGAEPLESSAVSRQEPDNSRLLIAGQEFIQVNAAAPAGKGYPALWKLTEVTNREFAAFWQSPEGLESRLEWEKQAQERAASQVSEFEQSSDSLGFLPWNWDESGSFSAYIAEQPVRGIVWEQALAYCQWLQKQLREQPSYEGYEVRLPKLEEWLWLSSKAEASKPSDWSGYQIPEEPQVVSELLPNNLGLVGMEGNVWEWLGDDYLPFRVSPAQDSQLDAAKPVDLYFRALAGGSWLNHRQAWDETWVSEFMRRSQEVPTYATSQSVGGQPIGLQNPYVGFRPVIAARQ